MLSLISANLSQIKKDSCQYCPKPHFLGRFQTFGGQCIYIYALFTENVIVILIYLGNIFITYLRLFLVCYQEIIFII